MIVRPVTVREAVRIVARWHRRHPEMVGAMWALVALDGALLVRDGALVALDGLMEVGVATVGRPCRSLQRGAERLEVTRVAVRGDLPGVESGGKLHANSICSQLYAQCARAARAMGAVDLLTYLHEDEPGTSLKAAGWIRDTHMTRDESHDRPSRPRKGKASQKSGRKQRWWAPWSEYVTNMRALDSFGRSE